MSGYLVLMSKLPISFAAYESDVSSYNWKAIFTYHIICDQYFYLHVPLSLSTFKLWSSFVSDSPLYALRFSVPVNAKRVFNIVP